MAMTIKVNGAVFEFDEVSEYLEFAEAAGLEGLPEEDSSGTPDKEPVGKDANGEDLYEGDYVTGSEANEYRNTNGRVVMEILGAGESSLFDEANISVRIVGNSTSYPVDSTKFVKLSDNLDEAQAEFDEINEEEVKDSPTEFRNDDLVRVTESFRDSFGDVAKINSILPVRIDGDGRVLGVGTVLIGDNHDKLRLVCRKEDRKDIEL